MHYKFFWLVGILLLLFFSNSCKQEDNSSSTDRPNIIFIMTDDHAYQALSSYNDRLKEVAPTPNLDRIAENGMRFDRCLVTNSICGPSRATILTGKYGHLNGFINNEQKEFNGTQQTFPKLLKNQGYQTALIGKWHLVSEPTGFDYWDILPGQGHYYNPDFINEDGPYQEEGYVTNIIGDKTLQWLDDNAGSEKPFMLLMWHKAPHREWEPALEHLDHFEGVTFPEPATLFDDYSGMGTAAKEQNMTISETMRMDADLKMWGDTTEYTYSYNQTYARLNDRQRQIWDAHYDEVKKELEDLGLEGKELTRWKYQRYLNDYLGTIVSVDESVGRLLDYLEKEGLAENTIVVYSSDQGFFLGEHGWFDKRFIYEESLKTPLLVSWPGTVKAGSVNDDIVSNLDFGPTFLDAAGINVPDDMQGESLVPLLKGNTPENWRKEHYYHYYAYPDWHLVKRHYGIVDGRYKLVHFYFDVDEWELYDLERDPHELNDVYDNPEYKEVRQKLHERLEKLREKYDDSDEHMWSVVPDNAEELKEKYNY